MRFGDKRCGELHLRVEQQCRRKDGAPRKVVAEKRGIRGHVERCAYRDAALVFVNIDRKRCNTTKASRRGTSRPQQLQAFAQCLG